MLVAGVICFVNLGVAGLWDLDEALFASMAREMNACGDWIVPRFNGAIIYDNKPPLMFWLMIDSFKVVGTSEFAARLPAAILAVGTTLITYRLARRLFSAEVGFWAGLATVSNIIFAVSARAATVDSAVTFLTVLTMALFAKQARIGESAEAKPADDRRTTVGRIANPSYVAYPIVSLPGHDQVALVGRIANPSYVAYRPKSWWVYASIGVLLGLGVLAKGPVCFLLPAASLGLFLLAMNDAPASRLARLPTGQAVSARCSGDSRG